MENIPEGLLDKLGLEMDATDLEQPKIQEVDNKAQAVEIISNKDSVDDLAKNPTPLLEKVPVMIPNATETQPSIKQNLSQAAEKPIVPKPQLIKRKRRNFFSQFTRKFRQSKLEKARETLKLTEQLEIYKAQDQDLRDVRNAISGIVKEKPQSSILGKIKSSVAPDLEVNKEKYQALREKISKISPDYTLTAPESANPSPKDVKKLLNDVKKSLKSCKGYNKPANKSIFKTIAQKITKVAYLIVGRKAIYDRKQTASFVDKVKKDAANCAQQQSEDKKR